jgi:type IV pilus assembly protein PilC
VPILEGLNITRETSNNGVFERLYGKVSESIREGETIAKPMERHSRPGFHPVALFCWLMLGAFPGCLVMLIPDTLQLGLYIAGAGAAVTSLFYLTRMQSRVVDDLVVNMIDVGEETGELDTMLYKVADTYDEEVKTLTDGLMALMEPLLICFLGGAVGFIVIALFMPLVKLISELSK